MQIIDYLTINSKLYENQFDHDKKFSFLSNQILNNIQLVINKKIHRIVEIEFYLYYKEHLDEFAHQDEDQGKIGNWYFHRQHGKNYKGGSFKGLDITFGVSGNEKCFGGILIRSIKMENDVIIEGPCKIVDYILKCNSCKSISEFVEIELKNNNQNIGPLPVLKTNKESKLYCQFGQFNKEIIYNCPRVGLTLKNYSKIKEKFLMKNYRFLIFPNLIKKYSNLIALNLYNINKSILETSRLLNTNKINVEKYIELKKIGESKNLNDFINLKNYSSKDLCELYGYLHKN